jgi:hypothetical protein
MVMRMGNSTGANAAWLPQIKLEIITVDDSSSGSKRHSRVAKAVFPSILSIQGEL